MKTAFDDLTFSGLLAAASLLFLAGTSLAQDFSTTTGGTWGNPAIWTPNGVPNGANNTAAWYYPAPEPSRSIWRVIPTPSTNLM